MYFKMLLVTASYFCVNGCKVIDISNTVSSIATKPLIQQVYFLIFLNWTLVYLNVVQK